MRQRFGFVPVPQSHSPFRHTSIIPHFGHLSRVNEGVREVPLPTSHPTSNQENTTTLDTQVLHHVPQHQLTPDTNHHILHTPTLKITPIRTLHAPKHLLNPIPLPQRPPIRPSTTQRTQPRLRPNTLMQTRCHLHHRHPPLKGVGFFVEQLARMVTEDNGSDDMRARRSRTQHAPCWERGRPARNPDRARKNLPL